MLAQAGIEEAPSLRITLLRVKDIDLFDVCC